MTVTQLSARSVKVQLTAEELRRLLPEQAPPAESPQLLRLLGMMLVHAEAHSGIPFSDLPVTVELLAAPDGGLAVYFTVRQEQERHTVPPKTVRLAAEFTEYSTLAECCRHLMREQDSILSSTLHQYRETWVLSLKMPRTQAAHTHHLLLEYGRPFRSSALNKARLAEYGICVYKDDAVRSVAQS